MWQKSVKKRQAFVRREQRNFAANPSVDSKEQLDAAVSALATIKAARNKAMYWEWRSTIIKQGERASREMGEGVKRMKGVRVKCGKEAVGAFYADLYGKRVTDRASQRELLTHVRRTVSY